MVWGGAARLQSSTALTQLPRSNLISAHMDLLVRVTGCSAEAVVCLRILRHCAAGCWGRTLSQAPMWFVLVLPGTCVDQVLKGRTHQSFRFFAAVMIATG